MGSVFGKESVKEPHFDIVLERKNANVKTSYEMRKYGERFAASVTYDEDSQNSGFGTLASYIGVFGTAKNEGATSMAMTAPVVMEQQGKPESIAMTAPVVMENTSGNMMKMMFMLPEEYDDMSKIPKPTNPAVSIEELPSEIGVVHRYNGKLMDSQMAKDLGNQLISDGVEGITEEYVMEHYQTWGYNPPFTLPAFRRNEVWLKLNNEQVTYLKEKFPTISRLGLKGGSSSALSGRNMLNLGVCGLAVGVLVVGFLFRRNRSQYRRV